MAGTTRPVHVPVLLAEAVDALASWRGRQFVDGTAGAGGHAEWLLDRYPEARLLALDRDPEAVEQLVHRLARFGTRIVVRRAVFDEWYTVMQTVGWHEADGVLLDLGFSSLQMDTPERGFSFMREGPLDMRMDRSQGRTAAELVNELEEPQLADLLRTYGEEPEARRIAAAIVAARPLKSTRDLAAVVEAAVPARRRREPIHPATLTFQALRIVVNDELGHLERFLAGLPTGLAPYGRIAIISFHSLEDRMVKRRFRELARGCICPPDLPVCACGRQPLLRELTRKPVRPSAAEVAANPRARSARLRIAERIAA